ncbi:pyrimidodiazepine synthase isoform X2 [Drosophila pseudoobscura]|uniref:Pyrimidodiazepine synthase isoform X2 n=1 Tax=Drosophila pseudoobscura pseudoobscura TaxID=46245 RepID=A0A6I8V1R6_DROPS|nr:pyrimidodiazepine synthase isoform X2 [Drosophila pseudoobscura]
MSIPQKHFKKGSTKPQLPEDGVLRVYSMRFCPFSQRVHLILDAKKIPHHKIYIDLIDKPEWYKDYSPLGKVPALQLTDVKDQPTLVESMIIAEFLDEQYPELRLFPSDPLHKAQDKILIERFAPVVNAVYPVLTCNANAPKDALTNFETALDAFEQELAKRGTPYFAGQTIGIVDYMIWPWFERFPSLKLTTEHKYELDAKRFGLLLKWRDLVAQDEAVRKTALDAQLHADFQGSKRLGKPQYDIAFTA